MFLELRMQDRHGSPEKLIYLPGWYDGMDTGAMSECVSMVVLWNPPDVNDGIAPGNHTSAVSKKFCRMAGWHGSGGFENINIDALFDLVGDSGDVSVHVFMTSYTSGFEYTYQQLRSALDHLQPTYHTDAYRYAIDFDEVVYRL